MSESNWKGEILGGLPASGDLPVQFSATGLGMHSEGVAVQFSSDGSHDAWVGNFQRGLNRFDALIRHPDGIDFIVIAGGQAYVVDPTSRVLKEHFGAFFETVTHVADLNIYVLGTPIDFEAIGATGRIWRSKRVALDGIRSLALNGSVLNAEAYAMEDEWLPFTIDVQTGQVEGGSKIDW